MPRRPFRWPQFNRRQTRVLAISGALLPVPKTLPGSAPTACVVAVRAAGGVAPERCTPVFM